MSALLAPDANAVQSLIFYYARKNLHHHVYTAASQSLTKRTNDPQLMFWKAYALLKENKIADAIRDFEVLRGKQGVSLAVLICLKIAHESAKHVDREEVQRISQETFAEEKSNREAGLFLAATVSMLLKDNKKAREYIMKVIEMNPNYPQANSLCGWIDLVSGSETKARKSQKLFEDARTANSNDVDAVLGLAAFYEQCQSTDRPAMIQKALDELNKCVVKFAWFTPALSEKARLLLSISEWDQAMEAATRSLMLTPNSIEALTVTTLFHLAKESKVAAASAKLTEIVELFADYEPRNPGLYQETAALFARFCGRNPGILNQCVQIMTKAVQLSPGSSEAMTELGYEQTLLGQYGKAYESFQEASKLDEANMTALYGMILCQVYQGQLDDAAQQFEFLSEIHAGATPTVDLAYIGALLAFRRDKDVDRTLAKLDEAARVHLEACGGGRLKGSQLTDLVALNPDLLLQIARDLVYLLGPEPVPAGQPPSPYFGVCGQVLQAVLRIGPGMVEAVVLRATARYLRREFEGAQEDIAEAIQMDPSDAPAHMLMAQVLLELGKAKEAGLALEQALSHRFEVRESARYFVLRAMVLEKQADWQEAIKVLDTAMALPGVRSALPAPGGAAAAAAASLRTVGGEGSAAALPGVKREGGRGVSESERASVYVHLAMAHANLGNQAEAAKVMQDATREFSGTAQAAQMVLVNSELALKRGDVQAALQLLKSIPPESRFYVKAKVAAGEIQLEHRQDKKAFLRCYEDLVAGKLRSVATLSLKAEAHMRVQEPDTAIDLYHEARKLDEGRDSDIAGKIGRAYVMKHDFSAAAQFYKEAIEEASRSQSGRVALRLSLAELYRDMKRRDDALVALDALRKEPIIGGGDAVEGLILEGKILRIEAQVHQRAGDMSGYEKSLQNARSVQDRLLGRLRGEAGDLVKQQRHLAAALCSEIAQVHESRKQLVEAQQLYTEALKHDERHVQARLALARLHLDKEELEAARSQCTTLLQQEQASETATLMLADIMLRSNEFDEAIRYFASMIEHSPGNPNYGALEQLIRLVRRAGRLTEVPRFLRLAERNSPGANMHPGYHYCKGLYNRYMRNLPEALIQLNQARKDPEWGVKSALEMLDIYLDPSTLPTDRESELPPSGPEPETVRAARKVREELEEAKHLKPAQVSLYKAYELLLTATKSSVEESLNSFSDVMSLEKESAAALLGLAYALILLKQEAKARNHLKRIHRMVYTSEEADALEKGYLLYADMHVQSGKNDVAQELCRACLTHNKSCGKAWEIQGLIFEKDSQFADAAQVYEMAWQFDNQRNPLVGYKLAFNYLKAKRYVEAINVCNAVLKVQPNYPKIRREVLDKARAALRP